MSQVDKPAPWPAARNKRTNGDNHKELKDIFQGGSCLESATLVGVSVLKLSVWPHGAKGPQPSFCVFETPPESNIDEESFADDGCGMGWESIEEQPDRRLSETTLSDEDSRAFDEMSAKKEWWRQCETAILPFNMKWRQPAKDCFRLSFDLPLSAQCLGLGERQSTLNLRSRIHTLFNTGDHRTVAHHDPQLGTFPITGNQRTVESGDLTAASIPFLMVRYDGHCWGLFVDTPSLQRWNLDSELEGRADIEILTRRGWQLYVMGPASMPSIVSAFTALTGRSKLPPLWSLGHQQSRWSYPDEETVIRIAHEFRSRNIPCDAIHLDINYLDEHRVFTFSGERFAGFNELIADLKLNHFRVVSAVEPGVKMDSEFFVFQDGEKHHYFCRKADGKLFTANASPGQCVFPDFLSKEVRLWWAAQHGFLTELGVAGIWNDMNEPSFGDCEVPPALDAHTLPPDSEQLFVQTAPEGKVGHFEVRNLYGYHMCQSTFEGLTALRPNERPFVLSRSGYAGIQRYAAVWLGDNMSWWEHLRSSIPMLINMGISGVPFCGVDIGGSGGDCCTRAIGSLVCTGNILPACPQSLLHERTAAGAVCL